MLEFLFHIFKLRLRKKAETYPCTEDFISEFIKQIQGDDLQGQEVEAVKELPCRPYVCLSLSQELQRWRNWGR